MKKISKKTILKRIKRGANCCPVCGSYKTNTYNHHVEYPEMWVEYFCAECGQKVATVDNSPYRHICDDIREDELRAYNRIQIWIKANDWLWSKLR